MSLMTSAQSKYSGRNDKSKKIANGWQKEILKKASVREELLEKGTSKDHGASFHAFWAEQEILCCASSLEGRGG